MALLSFKLLNDGMVDLWLLFATYYILFDTRHQVYLKVCSRDEIAIGTFFIATKELYRIYCHCRNRIL